jgi:hypothetical protein
MEHHHTVIPKSKFQPWEDIRLVEVVQTHGSTNWHVIAAHLPGRTARQCRERWANYINPALLKTEWTQAEDDILLRAYREVGPKWFVIASFLPGRGKNNVKSRYFVLQRRIGFVIENGSQSPPPSDPIQAETRETPTSARAEPHEMLQWWESFPEDGMFEWSDDGSHFEFF